MKQSIIKLFFLSIFIFTSPVASSAMVFGGANAPAGPGSIVSGCCEHVGCAYGSLFATPTGVDMSYAWLDQIFTHQLEAFGKTYESVIKKVITVWNESFKIKNSAYESLFKQYSQANQKIETARLYSNSAQIYGMDANINKNENQFLSKKVVQNIDTVFNDSVDSFLDKFVLPSDIETILNSQDAEDIHAKYYFPAFHTTSKKDSKKVVTNITNLIEPFPVLPKEEYGIEKTEEYEVLRKFKKSHKNLASSILMDIQSEYLPVHNFENIGQKLFQKMKAQGKPSQINQEGRVSSLGLIDLLIDFRFANDDWRLGKDGIHGKTQAGIMRELLYVQSLKLEVNKRILKRAQQLAVLIAQQQTQENLEASFQLNSKRNVILENE